MARLSRDETAPKMGHPGVVVRSDVGHPPDSHFENDVSECAAATKLSNGVHEIASAAGITMVKPGIS